MIRIQYNNGRVLQGVVLAFGDRLVRVAVRGLDDAVEYRLISEVWVSEDCEVVRIKFVDNLAPAPFEQAALLHSLFPYISARDL